ncbi:hypothetical protein PILCRDRAFT_91254 [Piloderma croceum F 1598]|uniref:Secreted protein n=1 Tax=Piloderma croceum (strain F 1598) TaxID=765440 RepID=A0A0C3ATI5_PILCF|nr:hypothetical protein PILCRDRAFT_91254 [Piloderma croceum F 1598]
MAAVPLCMVSSFRASLWAVSALRTLKNGGRGCIIGRYGCCQSTTSDRSSTPVLGEACHELDVWGWRIRKILRQWIEMVVRLGMGGDELKDQGNDRPRRWHTSSQTTKKKRATNKVHKGQNYPDDRRKNKIIHVEHNVSGGGGHLR